MDEREVDKSRRRFIWGSVGTVAGLVGGVVFKEFYER